MNKIAIIKLKHITIKQVHNFKAVYKVIIITTHTHTYI